MEKFKHVYDWTNQFVRNHLLLLIVVLAGAWWILGDTSPSVMRSMSQNWGGNDSYVMEESMEMDMAAAPAMMKTMGSSRLSIEPPTAYADFDPDAEERKIIKNANLELEVEDTEKAKIEAEGQIKEFKGSVTNMNSWEIRPGILAYNMTVRLPAEKFEESIEALTFLGVKKSENFSTSDITAQYRDNENRLKNLEARRERLRDMMERETDKLADVLQIDRELSSVQLQIENLESTLRRQDVDVSYSTLRLTLRPEPQIGDVENPYWSFSKSWKTSLNNLIQDSQGIADKLIAILVYIPIWVPLLIILWWVKKKITSRRDNKTTSKK